ncbi:hypothetical protein [Actinopolymorpha alba]|uniref:hypothetical protein n=1 Tax=Actinopolymorpha alba TaxID=533267 RepID=UPI0003680271|nr:hypothetical protein [Actinopolymorpha alba]
MLSERLLVAIQRALTLLVVLLFAVATVLGLLALARARLSSPGPWLAVVLASAAAGLGVLRRVQPAQDWYEYEANRALLEFRRRVESRHWIRGGGLFWEWLYVLCLFLLAGSVYIVCYYASASVVAEVQHNNFDPSDTAQVITAASALVTATGMSIAGILKALALLLQARAEYERARAGLPSPEEDWKQQRRAGR